MKSNFIFYPVFVSFICTEVCLWENNMSMVSGGQNYFDSVSKLRQHFFILNACNSSIDTYTDNKYQRIDWPVWSVSLAPELTFIYFSYRKCHVFAKTGENLFMYHQFSNPSFALLLISFSLMYILYECCLQRPVSDSSLLHHLSNIQVCGPFRQALNLHFLRLFQSFMELIVEHWRALRPANNYVFGLTEQACSYGCYLKVCFFSRQHWMNKSALAKGSPLDGWNCGGSKHNLFFQHVMLPFPIQSDHQTRPASVTFRRLFHNNPRHLSVFLVSPTHSHRVRVIFTLTKCQLVVWNESFAR